LLGLVRPPRAWLALVGLVALAFNLYFDRGLYRYPSESEKLMFVEEVARRTGSNRVLFVQAEESTFRLLALLLRSLHGISVVRVAHVAGRPEMAIIGRYAAELSLTDAAVLSTLAPAEGRAFAELSLLERYFSQQGVIYPTDYAEHRRTYYLYDLDFAGDATGQAPSAPTL